jgi:class 3 adenylate cyclase
LRGIMVADIVGSTELTARLDDARALELVRVHVALVRRGLRLHAGREVKHVGDGILAAFDEVANAVHAAADIQRRFHQYNVEAFQSLRVRIGIHAGEPVAEHNDLFGATVQMAFRLCDEAEADGILVSGLVRDLSDEQVGRFAALGERLLKGFRQRTPVFELDWTTTKPLGWP